MESGCRASQSQEILQLLGPLRDSPSLAALTVTELMVRTTEDDSHES